ncbi:MAG TPA: hypothetical protein VHC72_22390 [Bryobacteraceae bacterium]|nr:hypothetical protein [Bryobacteraceae bacterium]
MRLRIRALSTLAALGCLATGVSAQNTPAWSHIAGYTVNTGLAGPASGPVRSVWFVSGGQRLEAQAQSGKIFETTDFQHWKLNSTDLVPATFPTPPAVLRPEAGVQVVAAGRRYSVTRDNLFASDDGRAWTNLTGFNGQSIIGGGFSALAVSPANPLDIVASNQSGVWRSLDGGLSWQSLNDELPNLGARELASQHTVVLADSLLPGDIPVAPRLASVTAGKWSLAEGVPAEAELRTALAAKYGLVATAAAKAGNMTYAGTADGRVFTVAADGTLVPTGLEGAGIVSRIWIDPANPQAALAVSGARLYRTTNGGKFWDNITGNLNGGAIHGVTADSTAGVVYAATDNGVFSGRVVLNAADRVPARWTALQGDLPFASAWDVRLNPDGTLTVLIEGYGVYEAPAPHLAQAPRIVNSADMSDRAAAPGSLISVLGTSVKQATSGQNSYQVLLSTDQSSQLQVPFEITPGALQLTVQRGDGGLWIAPLNVKQASPAIFVDADGAPMVLDAASGLVIDPGTPIRAGSTIQLLATGLGRVTPDWPSGVAAPVDSPPAVVAPVTAFLDGTPVRVTRATLAPTLIGSYLVELQIPAFVNRGATELRLVVNGEESNRVKLWLDPGLSADPNQ